MLSWVIKAGWMFRWAHRTMLFPVLTIRNSLSYPYLNFDRKSSLHVLVLWMYIWHGSGGLGSFSVFETLRGNKWWGGSCHYMSFIKYYMHSSFRQLGNHMAQLFKSSCKHIREICVGYWWYVIWSNRFSDQGFSDVVICSRKSEEKPSRGAVSTVRINLPCRGKSDCQCLGV